MGTYLALVKEKDGEIQSRHHRMSRNVFSLIRGKATKELTGQKPTRFTDNIYNMHAKEK